MPRKEFSRRVRRHFVSSVRIAEYSRSNLACELWNNFIKSFGALLTLEGCGTATGY